MEGGTGCSWVGLSYCTTRRHGLELALTLSNMRGKFLWTQAVIPRRRQKILLQKYPADLLPPSATNPVRRPRPIQWEDGTIITWKGSWKRKSETSLYSSRRLQANGTYFKGTKAERDAPARKQEREERMAGMAKRIEEFRKVSVVTYRVIGSVGRPQQSYSLGPKELCCRSGNRRGISLLRWDARVMRCTTLETRRGSLRRS